MMLQTETQSAEPGQAQVGRRDFLKFCGLMAATLALPKGYTRLIANALAAPARLPVVWLEFQGCTGDTESFIRAGQRPDPLQNGVTDPAIRELLLDILSVDYHETLMVPSGAQTELSLNNALQNYPGQYVAVVEGSIPTANNGVYCTIRGRTALSIAQQVLPNARAVIGLGSCAYDGGLAAAKPNPTGAVGVQGAVPGLQKFVALPGCPSNVVNLVATIVYLLTFSEHQISFQEVLGLASFRDNLPGYLHLVGVQPEDLSLGIGLSQPLAAALPEVIERAKAKLMRWDSGDSQAG